MPITTRLAQCLAQDGVGVVDGVGRERATSASALLQEVDEMEVDLVDGELADQPLAEQRAELAMDHVVVGAVGGGLDPGAQQRQPPVQLGVQGHRGDVHRGEGCRTLA